LEQSRKHKQLFSNGRDTHVPDYPSTNRASNSQLCYVADPVYRITSIIIFNIIIIIVIVIIIRSQHHHEHHHHPPHHHHYYIIIISIISSLLTGVAVHTLVKAQRCIQMAG
jgi:uncharacterized integral membrane protein